MVKEVKKGKKVITTKKSPTKNKTRVEEKYSIEFGKFSLLFQSIAIIISVAAVILSAIGYISLIHLMNLFCISVICLAFSLFPKKRQ